MIRKVIEVLPKEERWKLGLLLAAMLASGAMQTLGIAAVMPFIALIANPELLHQSWVEEALARVGFANLRLSLVSLGVVVVLLFVLGNGLAALTSWFSYRFVWHNQRKITERLLADYLARPYAFFLGQHGSRLTATLLSEVKHVVNGVIVPCLDIAARGVSTLLTVAWLVVADPLLAALTSAGLGGAYGVVYALVRQKQRRLGRRQVAANAATHRVVGETFGGIKDVKVLGREASVLERFKAPSAEFAAVNASSAIMRQLPGYALETLATGGMLALLLYLVQSGRPLDQVLPIAGVYAVAGNRLIPAFHQMLMGLGTIRFHSAALDELHAELHDGAGRDRAMLDTGTHGPLGVGSDVQFVDVSFRYPAATTLALDSVSITIPKNSTIGIVGTTGSGKTTLVDLLLGLFPAERGHILIDGVPLTGATLAAWRGRIGYVPQHIFLSDDTVANNIAFGLPSRSIDRQRVERAAHAAHLDAFIRKLPAGYDTTVGDRGVRLSGGERQRVGIARALYHQPDILVMDEATSALDTLTEREVMEATEQLSRNRTIVLIAHRLTTVRQCDIIFLMEGGRVIAQGTYPELVATNVAFRTMSGESEPG